MKTFFLQVTLILLLFTCAAYSQDIGDIKILTPEEVKQKAEEQLQKQKELDKKAQDDLLEMQIKNAQHQKQRDKEAKKGFSKSKVGFKVGYNGYGFDKSIFSGSQSPKGGIGLALAFYPSKFGFLLNEIAFRTHGKIEDGISYKQFSYKPLFHKLIGEGPYIELGPSGDYTSFNYLDGTQEIAIGASLVLGGGVRVNNKIDINLRYNIGLVNKDLVTTEKYKPMKGLQFNIGIIF